MNVGLGSAKSYAKLTHLLALFFQPSTACTEQMILLCCARGGQNPVVGRENPNTQTYGYAPLGFT